MFELKPINGAFRYTVEVFVPELESVIVDPSQSGPRVL